MIGKAGLSPNNDYSNIFLGKKKKNISIIYTFVYQISLVENCSIVVKVSFDILRYIGSYKIEK